jgi:hypothetical protein
LALEIVTGTMVGCLFLIAFITALQRCKDKSSLIIPWKKSSSQKDHVTVYIGLLPYYRTITYASVLFKSVFKSNLCCLIVRIFHTDSEMLKDVVRFSRMELEVACEDFSNIIGSSPDSLVYKGTVKGGPEIAVISLCIKEEHWTGYLELYFQREVKTCSLSLQFFLYKAFIKKRH